ncbi:MAG: pyridoxamine 5'-phosphate oxidase family protein [Opitutaceae bacterium]
MILSTAQPAAAGVCGQDEFRSDLILKFEAWLAEAVSAGEAVPLAVALATVDREDDPDVRMVTLRHIDGRGFVVCTDLQSAKTAELRANPPAKLCFHWQKLGRQVRIRGWVDRIPEGEADQYFRDLSRAAQARA